MKISNPLLVTIRNSKKFPKIECQRVYTTAYKNGAFRVKFYYITKPIAFHTIRDIRNILPKIGWKVMSAWENTPKYGQRKSITIIASPLPKE